MINNHAAVKYEKIYNGTFFIMQYWTNGTVTLQCGQIQNRHNICRIKPYKYDTNVEDIKN